MCVGDTYLTPSSCQELMEASGTDLGIIETAAQLSRGVALKEAIGHISGALRAENAASVQCRSVVLRSVSNSSMSKRDTG